MCVNALRTCEDVLAQSGGAQVFVQVLWVGGAVQVLGRGVGALQVLDGQAVTQEVLVEMWAGPQLSIGAKRMRRQKATGGREGQRLAPERQKESPGLPKVTARFHYDEHGDSSPLSRVVYCSRP